MLLFQSPFSLILRLDNVSTVENGILTSFTLVVLLSVKVIQSCRTLCDPVDCTVHEFLQAGILAWVAYPFSRGSSQSGS